MKQSTVQSRANQVVTTLPCSGYKMGDKKTLNITMPDGTIVTAVHDTREWYSGRGTKYNSSVRHGNIVENMTVSQLNKAWKPIAQEMKRRAQRDREYTKYLATCNEPDNIEAAARKAVAIVYRGCGVYRVGWRAGNITCAIYGGYHDSCPNGVKIDLWVSAVVKVMAEYSDHVVKMDGSGNEFFFRDIEDADLVTNATEIYYVPDAKGGLHLNIQPAEAVVLEPKQLI